MQKNIKIVVASSNKGKILEIKEFFKSFEIVSMAEEGIILDIKEDGKSFEENALIKARAVFDALIQKENILILSDDSGLCVEALADEPNIYSARYANWLKGIDENSSDLQNNLALIQKLQEKQIEKSNARFIAAMVLLGNLKSQKVQFIAQGECLGRVYDNQKGDKGFGYDSLFEPLGFDKRMAEMELVQKNQISHRFKALENLKKQLQDFLDA